ncbi:ABC transporter ATP-binding protein [Mycoplasmopsis primatum]|uniref:ABC transporter ATP-binding protein n=1 Tax=Mycoplasmopsis primatum TaxID=55604 RepID=UPI000497A562|nr:ABC transporter ATP-binding protein [Mycoplasmopsis primatum]
MNAVEFKNITKEFPGIKANDNISFAVKKGSIHALIGENGAGKSTLMSILFGLYEPTNGEIFVNDKKVFFKGPNDANDLGIGMVHQHFKLVDVYTNLDNIIMGAEFTKNHFLDRNSAIKKIQALQNAYNLHFDLFQKSGDATVSVQQKVEIMKMLYRDNDILVFDEPTAVLTDEEIQGLLKSFIFFKKSGKTIIFISHKLKEIQQVADEATVLRLGKVAGHFDVKQTSLEEIVNAMVGTNVAEIKNTSECKREDAIIEFKNINTIKTNKKLQDVSFKVHAGEIVAIAGVEGNGQKELEQIISGMIKSSSGSIIFKTFDKKQNQMIDIDIAKKSTLWRSKHQISYIPSDRHHHGLILDYTILDNSIIRRLWDSQFSLFGYIKNKAKKQYTNEIINQYDVRGARNGYSFARSLSGGNQQKFIVGRELTTPHKFIIIVQPTRGLDVGAINNIHTEILREKEKGNAILLISYELDEVFALADTIAVINEGRLLTVQDAKNITREQIGKFMSSSYKMEEVENND